LPQWEYLVVRTLPDGRWVGWEQGVWREWILERVEDVASRGVRTLSSEERLLRQLGSRGWELTGIVSSLVVNAQRLYFKRPARATAAEPRSVSPQSEPIRID
jgi:hypothetical protein